MTARAFLVLSACWICTVSLGGETSPDIADNAAQGHPSLVGGRVKITTLDQQIIKGRMVFADSSGIGLLPGKRSTPRDSVANTQFIPSEEIAEIVLARISHCRLFSLALAWAS
jgi:hypothetical protein